MKIRKQKGFTLVELMIVVSIIGIIASVAIPAFLKYIRNAKMAEAPIMINGFINAEISFYNRPRQNASHIEIPSCFLDFVDNIDGAASLEAKHQFRSIYQPSFSLLGFEPASPVYFGYDGAFLRGPDSDGLVCLSTDILPEPRLSDGGGLKVNGRVQDSNFTPQCGSGTNPITILSREIKMKPSGPQISGLVANTFNNCSYIDEAF